MHAHMHAHMGVKPVVPGIGPAAACQLFVHIPGAVDPKSPPPPPPPPPPGPLSPRPPPPPSTPSLRPISCRLS